MSNTPKLHAVKNHYQFANAAWDNNEQVKTPEWPKTLKGLSAADRKALNAERIAWIESHPPLITNQMKEVHEKLDDLLMVNRSGSQRCFEIMGEPHLGKTEILMQYAYKYHCENTTERPFESHHDGDHFVKMPVVWVHTASTFKQTMVRLVKFCGGRVRDKDKADTLLPRFEEQVEDFGVKLIVLDDLHNLRGNGVATELKGLYEHLENTALLFTRTYDDCAALDSNKGGDQTNHRTIPYELNAPAASSREWMKLLAQFERVMPWCNDGSPQLRPHSELIHHRTGGRTGDLTMLLQFITTNLIRSNTNGEDLITEELIQSITLPKDHEQRRRAA